MPCLPQRESWWDGSEDSGDLLSPARAMALESWDVTPAAVSPPQVTHIHRGWACPLRLLRILLLACV